MLLFSASFFTLAPDSRRLAREKRNGKQRLKASQWRLFLYARFEKIKSNEPVSPLTQ
ncbi:pheST operon leader peptide PheM [Escherichia coli]|uniref:PheST operon leader peptide PheM n=3 Tax=Escherichia coli TaxID=562 RepID=A0A3K0W1D2_ECOLX|nr:phenylalanyl-tRNA synthetase (pheST) operon leader peptide [Escherichia coli]EFF00449.1 predicted protein [Escherichia coli FVEC1412]EFI19813.1 predicted protein [Escherichia coli FVEC1302]EFJ73719.1 hypothetical protein HMPREF9552_02669 [Escherichia coli MS 198-1]EFK19643.1 hypothetical protein HMPREF9530_03787 [Escherichia coli MS 21-1]EFN8403625.1 pheST operon leader peptide PheM [Escherichia coli O15]EFW7479407.1 pheST operon leader peptide PheM [Shigella sonnei]ESA72240.1 hypothetica